MAVFGPRLDGEDSEEVSQDEMKKLADKHDEFELKRFSEIQKDLGNLKIILERIEKGKRKPLGMPDDKPKRSSRKPES